MLNRLYNLHLLVKKNHSGGIQVRVQKKMKKKDSGNVKEVT